MIVLYGFGNVNKKVIGLTRDIRVQWALEEMKLEYEVQGIDHTAKEHETPSFAAMNPFKQLPVIDDEGFVLNESGAILIYLAEKSGRLIPSDIAGRADVIRWCSAVLNTLETPVMLYMVKKLQNPNDKSLDDLLPWMKMRLKNFDDLLSKKHYIAGDDFTVADILLSHVLHGLVVADSLDEYDHLTEYLGRCEGRSAYHRTIEKYEKRLGVKQGFVQEAAAT